ncbi:MAG: paraquat-inducible protein A [Phycisphaerales bacterium]
MRTAGVMALAALALYPPAMILPVLEVERMGHTRSATIWSGVVELLTHGQILVGVVVLGCSIIIPALKIAGIVWLSGILRADWNRSWRIEVGPRGRSNILRAIEWIGRWGMVDVLLVAILIAAVKLGSVLQIHPGPGIAAFAGVVVLSMLASAFFDPQAIWSHPRDQPHTPPPPRPPRTTCASPDTSSGPSPPAPTAPR